MKLTVTTLVLIEDTSNQYPIGWEWLDKVPLEDFTWLIEVFATMTDDINTYDFLSYDQELSPSLVNIDRKGLAYFLNHDQGYQGGIREYGHYIAAKVLDIKSEEDYMNHLTDMRLICNEL